MVCRKINFNHRSTISLCSCGHIVCIKCNGDHSAYFSWDHIFTPMCLAYSDVLGYFWHYGWILCFFDLASRYTYVITNLLHYLSSVYFVSQPVHVSSVFVVHHQEVYCIYTTICTNCCIYSIPPDDELQICPKHVEVDWQNKLRINSAASWFLLYRCIEMHGQTKQ